jgi:hypothetical protein
MGYVYLGQSRIASIFKELPVETLIDTLCDKVSVEELDIPDGVSRVGDYLFYNCPNLTNVIIPASVEYIGEGAFYNSDNIEVIDFNGLPPSTVGENAFPATDGTYKKEFREDWEAVIDSTNNLWNNLTMSEYVPLETIVTYSDGSTSSFLIEGEIAGRSSRPYYTTQIDDVQNATEIKIGKAVTSINSYAFRNCSSLTSVTIPSSVTTIGDYAFSGCRGLTSVTIPEGVISIGIYAFYNCSNLTSVTIPSSVTTIGDSTFEGCSKLTSVTIPSSVTSIRSYTFYNCSNLTSVTIPEGVTSIERYAFYNCSGLTSVVIPSSVKSIGDWAFYKCSGLTSVVIPSTVTSIGSEAFRYCSSLTSVTIPSSVTSIGNYAFSGCSGLTSITFEGNPPTSVGSYAFPTSNTNLRGYYLSEHTNAWQAVITDGKWQGMTMEEYIPLETIVTYSDGSVSSFLIEGKIAGKVSIPTTQIKNVQKATEIKIGKGVTSIGSYAFYYCSSLTSITIPNSVTSIGISAFDICRGLTSITIPNSVTLIDFRAFHSCSSLTSITFEGKTQSQVQTMSNYDWSLTSGKTIICTDGSFTTT